MPHKQKPSHPQAVRFQKDGLFRRLNSFSQLEARIAKYPTEKERGDAFEVFAEAYLVTQAQFQVKRVWSHRFPPKVRRELSLPNSDKGADGVYEDTEGNYNAFQVKFRDGRKSLSWGELSTFFGLADRAKEKLVITNSTRFADVVEERQGFVSVRGTDLDRLQRRDFDACDAWLRGKPVQRKPKTPLPHQKVALEKIRQGLETNDRVTSVMACGTGKTLVSLWVAEQMECNSVLVLVPSLALLRQTLHEWLQETSLDRLSYRCVCSDPTVTRSKRDEDELELQQADLDFPVNTNSEEVAEFLGRPFKGTRIVFTTYQSSPVVGEAMAMSGCQPFDLAIFDEAHKTTGRQGSKFSFALDDNNLPIQKRVFLTATPRRFDLSRKNRDGEPRQVYSMDSPEIYGPVVHTLSFVEAASKKHQIICNYQVVISVVTTKMVNDALLRHGDVLVDGDPHILGAVGEKRETVAAWLNAAGSDDRAPANEERAQRQKALRTKFGKFVEAGKLTRREAGELYRAAFDGGTDRRSR